MQDFYYVNQNSSAITEYKMNAEEFPADKKGGKNVEMGLLHDCISCLGRYNG